MTTTPLQVALGATAAGGMLGSLARFGLTEWLPTGDGFPTTVLVINVVGSALLALLPALDVVRRTPWSGIFLGTGVMGGFTTMSAASVGTVGLFESGRTVAGLVYAAGTLAGALVAVWLASRWVPQRAGLPAEVEE